MSTQSQIDIFHEPEEPSTDRGLSQSLVSSLAALGERILMWDMMIGDVAVVELLITKKFLRYVQNVTEAMQRFELEQGGSIVEIDEQVLIHFISEHRVLDEVVLLPEHEAQLERALRATLKNFLLGVYDLRQSAVDSGLNYPKYLQMLRIYIERATRTGADILLSMERLIEVLEQRKSSRSPNSQSELALRDSPTGHIEES